MQISQFLLKNDTDGTIAHYCPGCRSLHQFWITKRTPCTGAQWEWDGKIIEPTFAPSMKITADFPPEDGGPDICHYYLKRGQIEFLGDCTHALKGITMPLPALPEMYRDKSCLNF